MKNIFFPKNIRPKILIIDDEEDACYYLKAILQRTNKFEVSATSSPLEGLALAKSMHPDLILLDIIMPEMDGTEVAEHLREDYATRDILVVFFSVLVQPQDVRDSGGNIGGHPFIQKPIDTDELIARIEFLLAVAHENHNPSSH